MTAKGADALDGVFARERQREIARIVDDEGRARVTDLATRFGVSAVTIRKDLLVLEGERLVVRTHGGAIAAGGGRPELAFDIRERLQRDEKSRMGAAAAARVSDGESIVLDASTSALHIALNLKRRPAWHGLTVVTNSIRIASELAGHPGVTVLMLGGRVRWEALSVVGPLGTGSSAGSTSRRRSLARPRSRWRPASRTRWRRRLRSSAPWSRRPARSSRSSTTPSGGALPPPRSAGRTR